MMYLFSLPSSYISLSLSALPSLPMQAGSCVIQQGEIGDHFLVVESGEFDVLLQVRLPETVPAGEEVWALGALLGALRAGFEDVLSSRGFAGCTNRARRDAWAWGQEGVGTRGRGDMGTWV
jgi:hypothetical protein